ncbi:hypothetical protein ACHAQJ_009557 [Trichoderma viride]
MRTRRSKKATEATLPSSPSPPQPIIRRNPPRRIPRRANQAVDRTRHSDSSSPPGSPPGSSPSSLTTSSANSPHNSSPLRRKNPLLPTLPSPPQHTPSLPRHNSSPALAGVELPKGLTSVPRKGSIVFDPKPRRGAPRHLSVSSIATIPNRDYTDDEDYDQAPAPEPRPAAEILAERMAQREIEETEHEIWLAAIPSLARDAKNVIGLRQNKSTRLAYQKVLQLKKEAFERSRSIFFTPQTKSQFLSWNWVDEMDGDMSDTTKAKVSLAIKLANIATALQQIETIESKIETEKRDKPATMNLVPFLETMDTLFPRHFAGDENKQFLRLSLEIRTQRAIESVARAPQSIDLRGELGYAFCAMSGPNAPNNYRVLFTQGPYKPLAGLPEEELLDVCSDRVKDIWDAMSEGGKRGIRTPADLPTVRKKFPFQYMLGALKQWLFDMCLENSQLLGNAEQEQITQEKQRLLEQWRAEEELRQQEEQQAREEEQRAREEERRARDEQRARDERRRRAREEEELRAKEQALEKERRAWERDKLLRARQSNQGRRREETWAREERDGDESLPALDQDVPESSPQSVFSSQPEPQPRIQRREKAPTDSSLFHRGEVASLLRDISLSGPPTSGRSRQSLLVPEPPRRRPRQESRRQQVSNYNEEEVEEEEEDDQDEDDDDFEEDRRPIKRSRTATSSALTSRPRQQQQESHQATIVVAPAAAPTSSAPAPPSSSMPDFAAIERMKTLARVNARLNNPQTLKKRHVWSDRDSATLIDLIARRAASWAVINNKDSHLFELPRNAQAYRDRARNMKVDFLISDAVLPRSFDLVTLSKKEIGRLQKLGKNFARMEGDVDRNGKPTNTEFIFYED